ncbi:MAG: hypothetical protein WD269_06375 [Acidimicrobiia bacterium]
MRRLGRPLLVGVIAVVTFVVLVPRPALGCSCPAPGDLETAIANAPAAVVGTMVDKRDSGLADFAQQSIYRIEVEEWVKGDLGEVIDVYSASDGAGCGLETPIGQRIGLFLSVEGNRLTSNLCSTATPDVLLAAAEGPVMSKTGIPHLLVGGWNTPSLKVLDELGALVTRLDSRARPEDFANGSRSSTSLCPGGARLAHRTSEALAIWDLDTMELASRTELPAFAGTGVQQISCRSEDGSVVWYVVEGVGGAALVDASSGDTIATLPGPLASIGLGHVVSYDYEGRAVSRYDIETGDVTTLYENLLGENRGVYPAPNPVDGTTALVETLYPEGGTAASTLFIYADTGTVAAEYEIPAEASVPMWLDQDNVVVPASDFSLPAHQQMLYVVNVATGEIDILPGWAAWETTGNAEEVYGIAFGGIWRGDLITGDVEQIGTIADESAVALLVLEGAQAIEVDDQGAPPAGGVVTPPLTPEDGIVALEGGSGPETLEGSTNLARIVFLSVVGAGLAAGLVVWRRDRRLGSQPSDGDA